MLSPAAFGYDYFNNNDKNKNLIDEFMKKFNGSKDELTQVLNLSE